MPNRLHRMIVISDVGTAPRGRPYPGIENGQARGPVPTRGHAGIINIIVGGTGGHSYRFLSTRKIRPLSQNILGLLCYYFTA